MTEDGVDEAGETVVPGRMTAFELSRRRESPGQARLEGAVGVQVTSAQIVGRDINNAAAGDAQMGSVGLLQAACLPA